MRVIALLKEIPLLVFDRDLMWGKNETPILSDEMRDQTLLVKGKLDANILQKIWLTLDMPNRTRN